MCLGSNPGVPILKIVFLGENSNMVITKIRNNPIGTPYKIESLSMEWDSTNQNRLIVKANNGTAYAVKLELLGADK